MSQLIANRGLIIGRNTCNLISNRQAVVSALFKRLTSSTSTTTDQLNEELKVGDVIHGYKLLHVEHIKELNIKPYLLKHENTGVEHLHVDKKGDSNNVFSVSLRTIPKNSTGVAHILEHLALCGSKRYAVRDPFMKMLTRSLATFMNAMTGPDFTTYLFSTQNKKDFENLLNIYTDAVFFPRLRPVDFRQEGWRLEHEKPDKKETDIVIRGVVYNEMKGVFSSSAAIYGRRLLNHLFPDTTYRHESGGDPEDIPKLTHEELKKFHNSYYHPSNAKFFTYGDIPLENHLRLINELVLSKFSENSKVKEQSMVKEQERWNESRNVNITCPFDPLTANPEKQTTTSVSYMLPTTNTDLEEVFALKILSTLLIDGPNAPFYKNLIESGIGADYSPMTGIADFTRQPYFSVGLQNIKHEDCGKVHDIIDKTFQEAAKNGFPSERIDAILHNIELSLKHVSGNFGLRIIMGMQSAWNHDVDVIDYFKVNEYVDKFKASLANDKEFWKKLIDKHFLSNKHKLILTMNPDSKFEENKKEREKKMLEEKIAKLKDVDRQTVLYEGMELMKIQNAKEDLSLLPCLVPSTDISRDLAYRTELKFETHKGVKTQLCEQPTNEVVYFRALAGIDDKLQTANLIDYLPIFCDVATKLGAGSYNRHVLSQKVQLHTGGLSVSMIINPSLSEFDNFRNEIFFSSHCLRRNVDQMFDLWSQILKQIHFQENKDYLFQLIKATAADLSDGISHSGQMYAMKKSASTLSNLTQLDEKLSGLSYVARIKDMASKESIDSIAEKLRIIAGIAFDPFNMRCAINAEPEVMPKVTESLKNFIDNAQKSHEYIEISVDKEQNFEPTKVEDMKLPFSTHFVAKSLTAVPKLHEDFAKLVIMSKLISSKYLHREIREKGGAYGSGLRLSNSGILNFFSYRDPNTDKTMQIYNNSATWVSEAKGYGEKDIEESKLGVFQDIDRPVEPGKRGLNYFTHGETDDIRQEYRRRLLDVTKDDVVDVADRYLNQKKFGSFII